MVSQIQAVKYTLKSPTRTEIQTTNTSTAMQTKVTFQLNKCHFRIRHSFLFELIVTCAFLLFVPFQLCPVWRRHKTSWWATPSSRATLQMSFRCKQASGSSNYTYTIWSCTYRISQFTIFTNPWDSRYIGVVQPHQSKDLGALLPHLVLYHFSS